MRRDTLVGLPTHWTLPGRLYGKPLRSFHPRLVAWELRKKDLPQDLRYALVSIEGFQTLKRDEREGR